MRQFESVKDSRGVSLYQTVRVRVGGEEWDVEHGASAYTEATSSPSCRSNVKSRPFISEERFTKNGSVHESSKTYGVSLDEMDAFSTTEKGVLRGIESLARVVFPPNVNRYVAGLKGGLIIGMLLGCVTLCLFHQISSTRPIHRSVSTTSSLQGASKDVVASVPLASKPLLLPGLRIYLVSYGTYPTVAIAKRQATLLASKNISTTRFPYHGFQLVAAITVREQDAKVIAKNIGDGVAVHKAIVRERAVPILGTATPISIDMTKRWLSDVQSAVLASTAWANDHGRVSDALTATETAISAYPDDSTIKQTGIGEQLQALQQLVGELHQDIKKGSLKSASVHSIKAEKQLLCLHGVA